MGVLYDVMHLMDAIEKKREEMHQAAKLHENLLLPSVLMASQQLDELIVKAQREGRYGVKS